MNIFSIILLSLLVYNFVKTKSNKSRLLNIVLITALVETYLELGYFISIGSSQISYRLVTELLLFVMSTYILTTNKISKGNFFKATLLIGVLIFGILNLVINPYDIATGNINVSWDDMLAYGAKFENIHFTFFVLGEFFQFLLYIVSILAICAVSTMDDLKLLILKFAFYTRGMLVIGIAELIIKFAFKNNVYNMFCNMIFGIAVASKNTFEVRGSGVVLQGLTKEGSHYIYALFIAIIVLFAEHKLNNCSLIWIYVAIALSVSAMSFSALLFLFGIACLYCVFWIQNSNSGNVKVFKRALILMLLMSLVGGLFFLSRNYLNYLSISSDNFWSRRIISVYEELGLVFSGEWKNQSTSLEWSNRVRLLSVFETLKLMVYRPIFGHGIASVTSHGSTSMLLAGTGIVGTLLWLKFSFFQSIEFVSDVKVKVNKYYIWAITIWMGVNLLNSLGLRPFYEITTFVLMISFRILFLNKRIFVERGNQ